MASFTTNWALKDNIDSKKKQTQIDEPVFLSKETLKKIQLIKKAFR